MPKKSSTPETEPDVSDENTTPVSVFTHAGWCNLLSLIDRVQRTGQAGRYTLTLDVTPRDNESVWITAINDQTHPWYVREGMEIGPVKIGPDEHDLVDAGPQNPIVTYNRH